MRYEWLEEMVKNGSVSQKAAEQIYFDCEKVAFSQAAAPMKSMAKGIGSGIAALSAFVLGEAALRAASDVIETNRTMAAMQTNKRLLQSELEFKGKEDKVAARFDEIAKYAPYVAAHLELSHRLVRKTIDEGLTDSDIDKLEQMQASYSKMGPEGDRKVSRKYMGKQASFEAIGNAACDMYVLTCTDDMTKTAGIDIKGARQAMGNLLIPMLALTGVQLASSVAAGAINSIKERAARKKMEETLEASFNEAIEMSDPETDPLKDNKDEARKAFKTLVHFAPHVAAEPQAAHAFMRKLVSMPGGSGIHATDIKDLVTVQRDFASASMGKNPFLAGFTAAGKVTGLDRSMAEASKAVMSPYAEHHKQTTLDALQDQSQIDIFGGASPIGTSSEQIKL